MLTIRAMSDGKGYSSRHLEHSDYYAEGERVTGRWQGRGAELLGLNGEIKPEEFEALRQGLDPGTGEFFRQRQSADRVSTDGKTQSHGRHLYDFTISAPKSVSIMAVLAGDTRLIEAHKKAVAEALQELEAHAGTRVRLNGANDDRMTGNLAIAVYHHDTSRELDPQLHTHAVAANLTYDGSEGRWKALQAFGICERRAYLTDVYRNSLACEVRKLGYEIENRRDAKGRDCGFEIRGISDDLLAKYSGRSRQRDEAIAHFAAKNGRQPTDNEVAILVRESRADKLIEISTEEVRSRQRERLTHEETQCLEKLHCGAGINSITSELAEPSLRYAQDHRFERVSVSRDHDVLTEALRHGRGKIDHNELIGALALKEASGEIIRKGNEIATTASLKRELDMIDCINRAIGAFDRLGRNIQFTASDRLNPEQKRAVEFVLSSRDLAVGVSGAAGTGKTAALDEIRRGLAAAKRGVLAVAPTTGAVEELRKAGFTQAMTVERLLQDQREQGKLHNSALIVDEAGMVSGRQMLALLEIAEKQSARIIFSGDTRQIQSVEACDALRILEKESQLKSVGLEQVRRQIDKCYREAIQELRRDPASGFEKLDAIGAMREVSWMERAETIAKAFIGERESHGSTLVVCATHEEINRVTDAIRSMRKQAGELRSGIEVGRHVALNWTTAQKSDARNFRQGQILGFHRAIKGIMKNESAEVVRVKGNNVIIRTSCGEERALTAKQAKAFDVYERRAMEVAAGDRLLLTANRREAGFRATNGETVTVERLDEGGSIHLTDGRVLPRSFRNLDYGYAVTAHRSQGKTVDSVIISADGMQKELFYVAASRGRKSVMVVTSDKELLRESVGRSSTRKSASELARDTVSSQTAPLPVPDPAPNVATSATQSLIPTNPPQFVAAKEVKHEHWIKHSHGCGMER